MPLIKPKRSPSAASALDNASADTPVEELILQLASTDPAERRVAARSLGEYPQAADALCRAVAGEGVESIREPMFTALIRIGNKSAAGGLIPLLQSEDVGLRNGAIEALKTMPNSAAECLGEIFASTTDVRIFGVEILGALQHPDRLDWLHQVIEADSELNVCATAVEALLECGDRTTVAPLHQLLARFPDEPFLEFSIRTVLAHIDGDE